jgi:hypothetical protein
MLCKRYGLDIIVRILRPFKTNIKVQQVMMQDLAKKDWEICSSIKTNGVHFMR